MLPAAAPYIFTGLRIGVGLSWLAIVAAEMLTGGVGIGFFIWDAWNSLAPPRHHRRARLYRPRRLRARPAGRGARRLRHPRRGRKLRSRAMTKRLSQARPYRQDLRPRRRHVSEVLQRRQPDDRQGRVRLHHRPFRLRQVDLAQPRRRPDAGLHRRGAAGGQARSTAPARTAPWCSRTTRCCPGSPSTRTSASRVDKVFGRAKSKAERHDWIDAQSRARPDGARQGQAPGRDLRRHEAARRHRPRARHGAQGAAAGRAVRRARRADPRPSAGHA